MEFIVYVCDDFEMTESGVLVVFGNYAEFTTDDRVTAQEFIDNSTYNSVVCPSIYKDENGNVASRIIFINGKEWIGEVIEIK